MTEIKPTEWLQKLCDRWHTSGAPPSEINKALQVKEEVEHLTAENTALWELSDKAILAALTFSKKTGAELIRERSRLSLARVSGTGSPDTPEKGL